MKNETWRDVPSLPEYAVSSYGRIMRKPFEAMMPHGGFRVYGGVPGNGVWSPTDRRVIIVYKGKTYKVHRLICEAFNGSAPAGAVCMHLDENPRNNRPENLAWGTQKQNLNAPGFLSYCRSAKRARAVSKLTDEEVASIRKRYGNETQSSLAREYGVSSSHVCNIIAGRVRAGK